MSNYIKTNILCLGFLSAFALIACSHDTAVSQNFGTTEEKNAFWDESSNLKAWKVMDGSGIKLEANKNSLAGRVFLEKSGADGLSRAGIVYDASNVDGSPVDLSESSEGLCVTYRSDFDVEIRLDDGDFASSSVDQDLPYAGFEMKNNGNGSRCVSWEDFKKKNSDSFKKKNGDSSKKEDSDSDGEAYAKKVRSVQIVFIGDPGSSGEFDIQRLSSYARWAMWWAKSDGDHVNTGFDEGDEGTSGEWTLFGDSAEAHIEFSYKKFKPTDGGYIGKVIFNESSSNPDVGMQFLVAGKTTGNGTDVIHSADVSTRWKGICLEYESQMDVEMQLVPENANEDDILKLTFAKNDDESDKTVSSSDNTKRASHIENRCFQFGDVPNSDRVLKKLTTVRLKFVKENNSGTKFTIRRLSYLLPERLAVKAVGEYREVEPTVSSDYKSGKSFLWSAAVDGAHLNLGISNAPSGAIWANSPEQSDKFHYNFPDDVVADEDGNYIPSLVSKYHGFEGYMKHVGWDECLDIDCSGTIGFNTVSSNLEPADISAWGGFCIHYNTYNTIKIIIVTDVSAKKYWYADVSYSHDLVWGKVSWDAFQNIDEDSDEEIEDVLGRVTKILLLPYDGKNFVDKFGSYDQCGN